MLGRNGEKNRHIEQKYGLFSAIRHFLLKTPSFRSLINPPAQCSPGRSRNVFKLLNSAMGGATESGIERMSGSSNPHGGPETGRGRGGGRGRAGPRGGGGRAPASSLEACLVCEEMVSKDTMVFHLAHKHFQDKISHLPQQRPFKCPDCSHVNEFQGGLVKHYGSYHGVFARSLKDMGLLDAREDLSRTGVKFPRPKIERVFTSGPGNNTISVYHNTISGYNITISGTIILFPL